MGRGGGPRRAIGSQRRRGLLELNLRGLELDAFVLPLLPFGHGCEGEKGEIGEKVRVPLEGVCALSVGVEGDGDVYADALLLLLLVIRLS